MIDRKEYTEFMNSKKIKRILSVALSLSMVLSTNLTGFAAGMDVPAEEAAVVAEDAESPIEEAPVAEGAGTSSEEAAGAAEGAETPPECEEDKHDWEILGTIRPATCSQTGAYKVKCKICSKEDYSSTPRIGHTYELEDFVEVTQADIDAGTAPEGAVVNTVITKEPSCSEAGAKKYICGTCAEGATGHESAPVAIETLPHTWEVTERHVNATCTENGYFYKKCQNCDAETDKRDDPDAPKLYHTYEEEAGTAYDPEDSIDEKIDGDCTQEHDVTYTCQREECGHTETGKIRHEAHVDGTPVNEVATCEYPAMEYTPCTREGCSVRRNTHEVEGSTKLYHTYEEGAGEDYDLGASTTKNQPATCEADGEIIYTCQRAGCTEENSQHHTKTLTSPRLGHDYTSDKATSEVTKEPTCKEEGIRTIHCGNDPTHTTTEPIGKSDHTWTDVPQKDATCGENGLEAYTWCPVCEKYKDDVQPNEIPSDPTKHVYNGTPIVYKPATCTENGIGKYVCTVCAKSSIFGTIPAMHAYQMLDKDGNVVVNEEFAGDVESNSTVTGTDAGCLTKGYKTFTCGKCEAGTPGKTYSLTINALGHDYDEGAVTTQPTCVDKGVKTFTCKRAGCTDLTKGHSYTEDVDATAEHTFVQGTVPATCTEPQKTGSACSVCHAEDPDNPPVVDEDADGNPVAPALGHTYEDAKYQIDGEINDEAYAADYPECFSKVEATCANGGRAETKTYTCARKGCTGEGHTKVVAGEVPEHQWTPMSEDATCQHASYTYEKCSVCQEETAPEYHPELGPQKDHNYVLQTPALKPATCTANGIGQYQCSMCQNVKNQVIPAHHAYEGEDHKVLTGSALQEMVDAKRVSIATTAEATCAAAGEAVYTCSDCPEGTTGKEKTVVLAKLTHIYDAGRWKSEIEGGQHYGCVDDIKVRTCTVGNCKAEFEGHTIETPEGAMLEHDIDGVTETVQPATCTTAKSLVKICKTCGQAAEVKEATGDDAQAALGHTYQRENVLTDGELDEEKYKNAYSDYYSRTEASCKGEGTKGKIVYTCAEAGCEGEGHTLEVELAVPEHKWKPMFEDASCQGNAQSYEKCTECGKETVKTDMGSMGPEYQRVDHDYQFVEAFREATCTQNGLGKYQCPMCEDVKNEVTPAHHAYEDEKHEVLTGDALKEMVAANKVSTKENTPASCSAAGEAVYTCLVCEENTANKEKTVEIPQLSHIYDETKFTWKSEGGENGGTHYDCQDDVKIFTCQQTGCTHTKEEAAPATDVHDISGVAATVEEATCTLPKREVKICKVCSGEAERNTVEGDGAAPALGHAFQKMENGQPVLDANGKIVLVDDVDTNPLVQAEGELPTCIKGSKRTYTCKRCAANPEADNSVTVDVPPTGHDKEEKYIAATCEAPGKIIMVCKNNATERFPDEDQVLTDAQGNALDPALGHNEETVAEVKSTCKTKGHTAGVRCKRAGCQKVLKGIEELPLDPDNHEWEEDLEHSTAPNCKDGIDGKAAFTCYHEDTDETFTDEKTVTAEHKYGPETISGDGKYIIHTCVNVCNGEVCGHTENLKLMYGFVECTNEDCESYGNIVEAKEIPRKAPTCTEKGASKGLACPDCGTVFEGCEEIAMIPHTLTWVTKLEATCGKAGSEIQHCSVCDNDIGEARAIPATGIHTYESEVQDPDCEHPFRLSFTCKDCGQEDPERPTEEIGAPLGHNFVNGVCANGCGKHQVEASTSMSAFVDTKNKVRITALTKVNDKQLKIVEMGLLYATDGNAHSENDMVWYAGASSGAVKKKILGDTTKDGVYMDIGVGSLVTRELYGRAYVVTEDENGKQSIAYGELIKGTFQELNAQGK